MRTSHVSIVGAAMALTFAWATSTLAQDIILSSPIDCDVNATCYIQQYVDRDPGPGVQDYRCKALANDGHKGTDFALPSLRIMQQGVDVLAAADGTVAGARDGMADTGLTPDTAATIEGRECGNGLRIDHPGGWSTQYCHLKQGSVSVRAGDAVSTGQPIGEVGQSGAATFPHVHFSVRKDGKRIDPFNSETSQTCAPEQGNSLWRETPLYRPGGLITVGLFDRIPEYAEVKAGTADLRTISPTSPALTIWGYMFATRKNDILRLDLSGPDGTIITRDLMLPKSQALAMRAIGKKRPSTDWPAGQYTGTATLIRDGKVLEHKTVTLMRH